MTKTEIQAILSVSFLYIVRMLGLFMVLPVLPLLAEDLTNATPLLIGLALGIYGLFQGLLQIPLGLLSDIIGRKQVILGGLCVFIIGSMIAGFSDDIVYVILGRALQGCGAIASTLMALVADLTRLEHRSKAMAGIGMSIGFSFALSLILGPLVSASFGLAGIFLITAIMGSIGVVLMITLVPTPAIPTASPTLVKVDSLSSVIRQPDLLRLDVSIFLLHYLLMSAFIFFPTMLRDSGGIADDDHYLVYLSVLTLTFVLMGPFMWLSDRPGLSKPMVLAMILMFASAFVVLSQGTDLTLVITGMVLFFMAFNLLEVVLPSLLSKFAPAAARGTANGVYSSAQFLGAFAGGLVGGFIMQHWALSTLLWVNGIICLLWMVLVVGLSGIQNLASRTLHLPNEDFPAANRVWEALSSVKGIEDVVFIESEQVAYLKVNKDHFNESSLEGLGIQARHWM